jgi:hypothetical protein
MTAWARSRTSNLAKIRLMCVFTVAGLRNMVAAMSSFELPRAIMTRTSRSRPVSVAGAPGTATTADRWATNRSTSLLVTDGASSASPAWAVRMASESASALTSLSKKSAGTCCQGVVDVLVEIKCGQDDSA